MTQSDLQEAVLQAYDKVNGQDSQPIEQVTDEKENLEDPGVEEAAETLNNNEDADSKGGEQAPFEDELKNIDPEVREIVAKLDADSRKAHLNAFKKMRANVDRKLTELGQEKKIAESAKQLFAKYGVNPESGLSGVEKLIQFEKALETNPEETIKKLAEKFNISFKQPESKKDEQELFFTDEEKLLYQKLQDTEKTTKQIQEELRITREKEESRTQAEAKAKLEQFKNSKNESGEPLYPHFDELAPEMCKLENIYPNLTWSELYDKAYRLNDNLIAKKIEDEKQALIKKLQQEKEEKIKKAKSINSQSFKSNQGATKMPSMQDLIRNSIEKNFAF